ncbi:MAG: hypothetical protein HY548_00415 [Elusimicrobia bacterium]|nr:hypothetical protein [Elusimicrobiota bacterium]
MKRLRCLLIALGISLLPAGASALTSEFDYELDAYYTALDYYVSLTTSPIPFYENTNEWEIYKTLLLSSPVPRFMLLEASVNPLPCLGAYLKEQAPGFYRNAQTSDDLNWVESVTTGFEEPAAVSLFLGNIINFKPARRRQFGEGKGHMGYLVSGGNYHIKRNELFKDNWIETEWKVRGDRIKPDVKLGWSFRVGAKFHSRQGIRDVFYIGLRRSRTDYAARGFSWTRNSGFTYKYDFSQSNFSVIQHDFMVDKKFPLKNRKLVPALAVGFLWQAKGKYTAPLETMERKRFQLIFRPNIEF